ncbi:MAG: RNHCP domain-containing protein [Patescibacteria group bacterium]
MTSGKEKFADELYPDDMHGFHDDTDHARKTRKPWRSEEISSFKCAHCHALVPIHDEMGTKHRNHCPSCLWSKHVDDKTSGDRASDCGGGMKPIGITLKREGTDKFTGKPKYGDVMLVHECTMCGRHSINRIAADDSSQIILQVFEQSESLPEESRMQLESEGIILTRLPERPTIEVRLFGKK